MNASNFKLLLLIASFSLCLNSCGDDDEVSNAPVELIGTWADEIDSRSISVTFNSSGWGQFVYTSRVYLRVAEFQYTYKDGNIQCKGALVDENGKVSENWTQSFHYYGTYIKPEGMYGEYTLKKIGSNSNTSGESNGSNNGNNASSNSSDDVSKIVASNVSVTSTYSHYAWHIGIRTQLSDIYPSKKITYGISCGYNTFDWKKVIEDTGNYLTTDICVFIDANGSPYAEDYLYWKTLMGLIERLNNHETLSSSEKDLYNSIVKRLNKDEPTAKRDFVGRVYVEIDGQRYYIKQFA